MPVTTSAPDTQAPDAPFLLHRVRVARRERVSEGFVRLTFAGETLDGFADPGLDQRIKLILPLDGETTVDMPFTADWWGTWRSMPDERRPVIRTYTTRAVRPHDREVDVDVVLHEPSGPAGRFAASCRVGDEAVLLGPNARAAVYAGGIDFRLPPTARCVLVAGDETALPAIARILAQLPDGMRGTAIVEVPHASDGAQLPAHPGVDVQVLERGAAPSGSLLDAAVRAAAPGLLTISHGEEPEDVDVDSGDLWEIPGEDGIAIGDGPFYAWLAGEAGVIKALRRLLVADLGVDRRSVAFMGYWRQGRSEN
jgi:NADPH-dependent ferric siderophore reductase